jgi:hypothetical protein
MRCSSRPREYVVVVGVGERAIDIKKRRLKGHVVWKIAILRRQIGATATFSSPASPIRRCPTPATFGRRAELAIGLLPHRRTA